MGSKEKSTQQNIKAQIEKQLAERLAYLNDRGTETERINKDTHVKQLKAKFKAVNARLKTIDAHEKKTEELARIKAEKLAAPRKESKEKEQKPAPAKAEGKKKKKEKSE